ncbi:restriction endonuclease subunit S [Vibrio harveyi]|uniref:restriction endonuclease subunit S n=1 Tax=Vibrio harveyi TaxID=669 RepID=UPI001C95804A|nr:restriction endonuclease subunit S [Vibrio harveyi]MBY6238425.1 restriction endonuclease subunit S [Vibrio harveyi]
MNKCVFEGWQLESTFNLFYIKGRIGWKGLKKSEFQDKGPYLITGIHFKKGKIDWNNCFRITEERYEESPEIQVKEDDILITKDGTIGKVAFVESAPEKASLNSHLLLVRAVDERVVPRFAYYVFESESFRSFIELNQSGSTLNGLPQRAFERFELLLPTISEQKKIAAILTSVDDVIEKTQAQIDKLNDLKTGMMQELLTRGVGVDGKPHTEFKDSPVGRIPKGWDCCLLDKVARRGSGHTPDKKKSEYWNDGVKWVSLTDSSKLDKLYISDTAKKISQLGIENSSATLHPKGTVVMARDAGVGKSAIMTSSMAVSQHFMAWVCGEKLDNYFLYYLLQHWKPQFEAIAMGSTIKTIGLPYFKKLQIPVPSIEEQRVISGALKSVDNKMFALERKHKQLTNTKKALMQDLLTGKVRVKVEG